MSDIVWDREAAAHLLRRAGLPGPPGDIEEIDALGLDAAVERLLDFEAVDDGALEARLASLDLDPNDYGDVLSEWLVRLVHTRRPFLERVTLFWHMHFATSIGKVQLASLLRGQLDTFRRVGLDRFDDLLLAVARDPAMLIWLDNIHNHVDAPNENWARELMELYSMGIGTYTQDDVLAAARAFTGWTLARQFGTLRFVFLPQDHDYGTKTFLGHTGAWDGDDIIRLICEQPVTPRYLAAAMWDHFASGPAPDTLVQRIEHAWHAHDHSLHAMFTSLFTAPEFYADEQRRQRPKGPVEFTCGLLRQLEAQTDGRVLAPLIAGQGQALLNAPDPSGWTEGMSWVTTASLLLRSQLASIVGLADVDALRVDLSGLVAADGGVDAVAAVEALCRRLDLPPASSGRLTSLAAYLTVNPYTGGALPFELGSQATEFKLAGLVHVLATDPAYQLA